MEADRRETPPAAARQVTAPTRPTPPADVMNDVTLLLSQVTAPETYVAFNSPRATTDTIKGAINPANVPLLAWTWEDVYARDHQAVTNDDVGKVGYQVDIDSYFELDNPGPPAAWLLWHDPTAASPPLELSTGASDAVAYHDFYKLQIAFEDVWAELIDRSVGANAQAFYARWDALMNVASIGDIDSGQFAAQLRSISSSVAKIARAGH